MIKLQKSRSQIYKSINLYSDEKLLGQMENDVQLVISCLNIYSPQGDVSASYVLSDKNENEL